MKKFLKNLLFGVDVNLYVPLLMYKIYIHQHEQYEKLERSLNWRVVMATLAMRAFYVSLCFTRNNEIPDVRSSCKH